MSKKYIRMLFILCVGFTCLSYGNGGETLSQLYEKGRVRFVKEMEITDASLPEDMFFQNPLSLSCHEAGAVFVGDWGADHLKVFFSDGRFQKTIGQKGQGPGEFHYLSKVEVSPNRILVWENGNRRVSLLTLRGEYIKSLKFDQGTGYPMKIRSLPDGKFVLELEKQIQDAEGNLQQTKICLYDGNLEYIDTMYEKKLVKSIRITKPGRAQVSQPFNPRVYWDVSREGHVVIGFSGEYRIDVFQPLRGKLFSFDHEYSPVRVLNEDRTAHFSKMTVAEIVNGIRTVRQGAPDYIKDNTGFPKLKPAFKGIIVDPEGNILVFPYHRDRDREDSLCDAFSPEGRFINRVEIDGNKDYLYPRMPRMTGRVFWIIERDEEAFRVVRYRISI